MTLSDAAVRSLRVAIDKPDVGDRYVVHEMIGRGGMGTVYHAFDSLLQRDVALKVLRTDAPTGLPERLLRESRLLARLEHPGIVGIYDAGTSDDGRPFYVMRLIRGERLDAYARRTGRGELLRAFLRVCDAVSYAHSREVIHRDLTPANVMIGEFGEVLVLDWGVARSIQDRSVPAQSATSSGATTGDGVVVGTPGFMAPEQAAGATALADARADVYGLGAILRFILSNSGEGIPRPLAAIVGKATATDPLERYPSVDSLADDTRRFLDGQSVSSYSESMLEKLGRFYRRNHALVLLLLAYAVIRVVILLWRGV
jgi:serine/threonine protein kinase